MVWYFFKIFYYYYYYFLTCNTFAEFGGGKWRPGERRQSQGAVSRLERDGGVGDTGHATSQALRLRHIQVPHTERSSLSRMVHTLEYFAHEPLAFLFQV